MQIIIPLEGRVRTIIRSGYIIAKRTGVNAFQLSGDTFNMCDVAPEQVLLLPDDVTIAEGDTLTNELQMLALPMETFLMPSAEDALSETLGLLLRAAVADGKITDAELLRVAPTLEGRQWQPGIAVTVGDVYTYDASLWKCVQAHTTQGDWQPDHTPALWHKVEVVNGDEARVWAAGIEYAVNDVVAYPDAASAKYKCLQAHTAQEGWQPPNVPALWKEQTAQ